MSRFSSILRGALVSIAMLLAVPAQSGTISLSWGPVEHETLEGYRVYYGTDPVGLDQVAELGIELSTTLDVADCTTYHVGVKAFDAAGQESPALSNIIAGWARPVITQASPTSLEQNGPPTPVTIDGANFQAGATVVFSDPGIIVEQVVVESCNRLVATLSVGASAGVGSVDVEVVNPDQVFGAVSGLLQVGVDGTGPEVSSVAAGAVGSTTAVISWETSEPATGQVRFRRVGETLYQISPSDADLVTDHAITLEGLMPTTPYEFHVESTDGQGNATSSTPDQTFTTLASSFQYMRVETESGAITAPLAVSSGAEGFRGAWLELPDGSASGSPANPNGTNTFQIYVPHQATWSVWVRMHGPGAWFEQVDGSGMQPIWPQDPDAWSWVQARSYSLAEGLHTLMLGGRDPGAAVDRILITDDPNFTPTEQPGGDVTPPDPAESVSATAGDSSALIALEAPADPDTLTAVVRYRTDGSHPLTPLDGYPVVEQAIEPGGVLEIEHGNLQIGTTYRYSVFVIDASGNASASVEVEAVPLTAPPESVENVARTDTK